MKKRPAQSPFSELSAPDEDLIIAVKADHDTETDQSDATRAALIMRADRLIPELRTIILDIRKKIKLAQEFLHQSTDNTQWLTTDAIDVVRIDIKERLDKKNYLHIAGTMIFFYGQLVPGLARLTDINTTLLEASNSEHELRVAIKDIGEQINLVSAVLLDFKKQHAQLCEKQGAIQSRINNLDYYDYDDERGGLGTKIHGLHRLRNCENRVRWHKFCIDCANKVGVYKQYKVGFWREIWSGGDDPRDVQSLNDAVSAYVLELTAKRDALIAQRKDIEKQITSPDVQQIQSQIRPILDKIKTIVQEIQSRIQTLLDGLQCEESKYQSRLDAVLNVISGN